ncbi:MAG TPA: T9SS type A sorting domain-containing protein, partial [Chitinophagaceae bacterium]|nr:T9SS type A sorting domain-containing protein [Chitinophagaceae bacterium]
WPNPNPIPTSYVGEINALKEWIVSRLFWIDYNIPNAGACEDWQDIADENLQVSIYPNPNNGIDATIKIKTKDPQTIYLNVFDGIGRLVHSQSINAVPVSNFITIEAMKKWQAGIYYFIFSNKDGEKISKKIVKQ